MRKYLNGLTVILFVLACLSTIKIAAVAELLHSEPVVKTLSLQGKIKIIRAETILRHGDAGIITIQGTPGVRYVIESSFNNGERIIPVSQWRTADSSGLASFNWIVADYTVPGSYPVRISGGGEVMELTHTVLP